MKKREIKKENKCKVLNVNKSLIVDCSFNSIIGNSNDNNKMANVLLYSKTVQNISKVLYCKIIISQEKTDQYCYHHKNCVLYPLYVSYHNIFKNHLEKRSKPKTTLIRQTLIVR